MKKIYVGNLSYNATEAELADIFGEYGEVLSARILTDRDSGRSKGFGFVEMAQDQESEAAIQALNGADFKGRGLIVNEARPMAPKGPRTFAPRDQKQRRNRF
jgi:RNA recognition motif-containing protein